MAGMDYSSITTRGFPKDGRWVFKVESANIGASFSLYKTSVYMRLFAGTEGPLWHSSELLHGEFVFPDFWMKLWRDQDGWLHGCVMPHTDKTTDNCFAFCGFYDGDGGNREIAKARLRIFLAREDVPVSLIHYGQDDPEIVAAVRRERDHAKVLESFAEAAEEIERRAGGLREAIDAYRIK